MLKFAVLLLQVAQQIFKHLEQQRLIKEGERRQIAKELEAIAKSAKISQKVKEDVGKLNSDEIDAALRGDFRD
jgi:hypothetical protein